MNASFRSPLLTLVALLLSATSALAAAKVAAASAASDSAKAETTLDGVNLVPFVTGKQSGRPHEQLFWRAGPQHAARVGDWKLVNTRTEPPMLFNLKDDIGEKNDLAASNPAKLKELQTAFADWEKGTIPAKWVRQDARNAEEGGTTKSGSTPKGAPKASNRIAEALKNADKNNDGKLSREEYPKPELFDAIDANKDGFATTEEIKAYYAKQRDR